MENGKPITKQLTLGDIGFRGTICYPLTQPIWWLVLPVRWTLCWLAGCVLGQTFRYFIWRKILTPANFLTALRFLLLAKAINLFIAGAPLSQQATILFFAIITDFFDGPLARNNDEVTELGTYMDHLGDWSVAAWIIFLSFWHDTLPLPYLVVSFLIIPLLLIITVAKFRVFRDPEVSWIANANAFATEILQSDFWGRLQFLLLAAALLGSLFIRVSGDENFFFYGLMQQLPQAIVALAVNLSLAFCIFFGGYNTKDAITYSEAQAKKFRETLRKIKSGSQ